MEQHHIEGHFSSRHACVEHGALYIAFVDHHITITVDCSDVAAQIERWFLAMLTPTPGHQVGHLTVCTEAIGYRLSDGNVLNKRFTDRLKLLQALKYEVVTRLIAARPDLLWFHAGAVANEAGALLIAAPGGGGKSTLITHLCQHGWRYLSDDAIPLDMQTQTVLPFPQTPRVRKPVPEVVPSKQVATLPGSAF